MNKEREQRQMLEEELIAIGCLHPDYRQAAEDIMRDLIHDQNPDIKSYQDRMTAIYDASRKRAKLGS